MDENEELAVRLLFVALENPALVMLIGVALIVLLIAAYITVFYVIPGLLLRAGARKLESLTAPRDAAGRQVERTLGARVLGQRDIAPLSSRGMNAQAEQSLNTTIMRTTWGMRISCLFFSAATVAALVFTDAVDLEANFYALPAVAGIVLIAIAHVFSYELRYDREGLISQSLVQFRKEMGWRDLVDIKDDGRGTFRLTSADGRKMRVQKYLVGMGDFLTTAQAHIRGHVSYA